MSRQHWSAPEHWESGTCRGVRIEDPHEGIAFSGPAGTTEYRDPHGGTATEHWEFADWTSAPHRLRVPARELVVSWNARTPAQTWLRTEVRVRYTDGTDSPWYTLGIWTAGDGPDVPRRTSVDGQGDGRSSVWTDTLSVDSSAGALRIAGYRLRVGLLRAPGSGARPAVRRLGVMTSDLPDRFEVPATAPGPAAGTELDVPRYSQNVHIGRYPEYDNGGEAWCSPTSTQMIVEYWGRHPRPEELAWVEPEYDDPQVCHAARRTYDHQYEGCGNWPFSTAYAATYRSTAATVTRLDSLREAELLVAAGIPLVTSQSFLATELDGAGYGTAGHLMTVIGFTADGDVIANDPNAPDNDSVRRVYPRHQFETVWLRTRRLDAEGREKSGSGGVAYVIWPAEPSAPQRRALRRLGLA